MSGVKPKPNELLQPSTANTNYTANQSEPEANEWCQARENACEEVAIGWVLLLIGRESGARYLNQSESGKAKNKTRQNENYFRHSIENRF